MNLFRSAIAAIALSVLTAGSAFAQCGTTAPANTYCGNSTGSSALATFRPFSTLPAGSIVVGTTAVTSGTSNGVLTNNGALLGNTAAGVTGQIFTGVSAAQPAWSSTPILGIPGTTMGTLRFGGSTSGTVTVTPQAVAGSPTITLPSASGTIAVSGTSPLVLSATTGDLTCPTCVTSSGGGAISGTAPIAVSGAGVVSINAPYTTLTASNGGIVYSGAANLAILAGTATARQMLQSGATAAPAWSTTTWPATSTINRILYSSAANVIGEITTANGGLLNTSSGGVPSITATPVLGVAGTTVGTIGFQNATSGTITLSPVTGALGSVTLSLPAATDTLVGKATSDVFTNKTYNAQGTGNVFQLDGVTVTGKAAASDYYAGTSTAKLIAPSVIYPTETTTTYGTTTTFDFSTFINTAVTLTGNITTMTLTNVAAGKAGTIAFIQDGSGSKTSVFSTTFKFASGTVPTLTTTANAVDILTYSCRSASFCVASLIKDVRNP